ncbi:MAG: SLC13 family permease [Candidatus Saliniplasma sp.]
MMNEKDEETLSEVVGRYYKQILIFMFGLFLLISTYFLPVPVIEELSGDQRAVFGILLFAAVLWITEAIPLYATSILIVLFQILFISEETVNANEALAPFFNTIIALFLGGFALAAALHKYNVDNKLAKQMIKSVGKSPKMIMFGMMFITAFLSMWMSNTATTALMIALALPIYTQIPKEEKFSKALILGIPFAANIGGMATPIGTPPNAIIIERLSTEGIYLSFLDWVIIALPITILMFLFAYFVLYFAFKPSIKELDIDLEHKAKSGFSRKQIFILVIFSITVLLWLTSSVPIVDTLFQSAGIIALIPVVVFFGTGLLDKDDLGKLNWNVLLLMGGGMSLGNAMRVTGLAEWMVSLVDHQALGLIMVVVIFSAIAIILSTFMSNTATAALMAPIMIIIGMDLGSSISIMASVALACSMAMALPVSTPPNAIAYGTDKVDIRDMMKYGALISIVGVTLLAIIFGVFMVNLF